MAIRPEKGSFYDFTCGNDFRRVKLAIKTNTYHAVKVSAEIAQSINFTGGLARIDEILLYKCFKLTRVMWPADCGFINIFKIYHADSMGRLDVSPLQELEQLSIQDCDELEELTGIPKKIKSIVIVGSKLKQLKLSHFNNLENVIILTSASSFDLQLDHCDALKSVSVASKNITAKLDHCKNLKTIHMGASDTKAIVDIVECPSVQEAFFLCGPKSEITGLSECLRLNYLMLPEHERILTDISRTKLINNIEAFNKVRNIKEPIEIAIRSFNDFVNECRKSITILHSSHSDVETIIQENSTIRESTRTCSVMILLLSLPHANHQPEMNKYYGGFMGKHVDEPGAANFLPGAMQAAAFVGSVAKGAQAASGSGSGGIPRGSILKDNKYKTERPRQVRRNNKDELKHAMRNMQKQVMKVDHWLREHGQKPDIKSKEIQRRTERFLRAVKEIVSPAPAAPGLYQSFPASGAGAAPAYAPTLQNMFRPNVNQNINRGNPIQNQNRIVQNRMNEDASLFVLKPAPAIQPIGELKADPLLIPIPDDQSLSDLRAQGKATPLAPSKPTGPKADPLLIPDFDENKLAKILEQDKTHPYDPTGELSIIEPDAEMSIIEPDAEMSIRMKLNPDKNISNNDQPKKVNPDIIPDSDQNNVTNISEENKTDPVDPIPAELNIIEPGAEMSIIEPDAELSIRMKMNPDKNIINDRKPKNVNPEIIPNPDNDINFKNVSEENKTNSIKPIPGELNIEEPGAELSIKKPLDKVSPNKESKPLQADASLISYSDQDLHLANISIELDTKPSNEIEGELSIDKPEEIEGELSVDKPLQIPGVLKVNKPSEVEGDLAVDKKMDLLAAAKDFANALNFLSDAARGICTDEVAEDLLQREIKTVSLFKRILPSREEPAKESMLVAARRLTDAFKELEAACQIQKHDTEGDDLVLRNENKNT